MVGAERHDGRPGRRRSGPRWTRPGYTDVGDLRLLGQVRLGVLRPVPRGGRGAPQFGDRAGLPAGPGQRREALREVRARRRRGRRHGDGQAGPGLPGHHPPGRRRGDVPVAAYQVSGEYAMVEAAAANGWLDRERAILETLTAIRRAGAGIMLTYWATEVARKL